MPNVIADITMSLDGFVTGEGADEQHGLGDAPELHTWAMQQDAVDTEILERATAESGAVVMGRRLFDIVNAPDGWNKDMGYGADQTGTPPFFVVTHSPPRDVRLERELGMLFTFVSDLVTAIDQARSAATHGDVVIMGGGDVIGQALEQGLVDELRLHLAPMVLGGGTPLFKQGRARCTGNATFARRGTPCTSPTNACRSRRRVRRPLHSSAGGKEMNFLSRPQLPIRARGRSTEHGARTTRAQRVSAHISARTRANTEAKWTIGRTCLRRGAHQSKLPFQNTMAWRPRSHHLSSQCYGAGVLSGLA
jgi:dihydrofolate reductase